jgi:hypothetical protein
MEDKNRRRCCGFLAQKTALQKVFAVYVNSAANVTAAELVLKPTVDDYELGNRCTVLAVQ